MPSAESTKPQNRRIFNLLKPFAPPPTAWDQVYDWIMTRARVVMVIAEILVALAFVGKVAVDIQAKNLDEQIAAKDRDLNQFAISLEPTIRQLQQKSAIYMQIWRDSNYYSEILRELNQYLPESSNDLSMRLSGNQVIIRGGDNLLLLSEIEAKLKNSATFETVAVSNLTSEGITAEGQVTANYVLNATIAKPKRIPLDQPNTDE